MLYKGLDEQNQGPSGEPVRPVRPEAAATHPPAQQCSVAVTAPMLPFSGSTAHNSTAQHTAHCVPHLFCLDLQTGTPEPDDNSIVLQTKPHPRFEKNRPQASFCVNISLLSTEHIYIY